MRPKKVILVVDHNKLRMSVLSYTLTIHGFRALQTSSEQEAIAAFAATPQLALVMIEANLPNTKPGAIAERMKILGSHVPIIMLSDIEVTSNQTRYVDAFILRKSYPMDELLEHIKVMSVRKRGPRKRMENILLQNYAK